jgi:hypothetical protein
MEHFRSELFDDSDIRVLLLYYDICIYYWSEARPVGPIHRAKNQ